ncbi:MAG: LamG-like jellyroll fold domain-containing protein [Nanoarchaeota archaeon]|nr:LamG-like jellyroll fold domain-containing protein [Nanoarchaeota archaeon]
MKKEGKKRFLKFFALLFIIFICLNIVSASFKDNIKKDFKGFFDFLKKIFVSGDEKLKKESGELYSGVVADAYYCTSSCQGKSCGSGDGCGGWCSAPCNDNNLCTTDSCTSSGCRYTAKTCPAGQTCNPSTGICVKCTSSAQCNDNNLCTTDSCTSAGCTSTPVNCDDGISCTLDSCSNGECINTQITNCMPDDGCCLLGCSSNNDNDCLPECGNGKKEEGEECDDGNIWPTDSCIDCKNARCGDGHRWILREECDEGPNGNKDDGEGCGSDCKREVECNDDSQCDDRVACTIDKCNKDSGKCYYKIICNEGNPCTDDVCLGTGMCVFLNLIGKKCDDNDVCTINDFCFDKSCRGQFILNNPNPFCREKKGIRGPDFPNPGNICYINCDNRECGNNGCGGSCGECEGGKRCNFNGVCEPDIGEGDGGGEGTPCVGGDECNSGTCDNGQCTGEGGDVGDPCDGDGDCNSENCDGGECAPEESCTPNCSGKQCGDDGCGESCGDCPADQTCEGGQCVLTEIPCKNNFDCNLGESCDNGECEPSCTNNENCNTGEICKNGVCMIPCTNNAQCQEIEECVDGVCEKIEGKCSSNNDCYDGIGCTVDSCVEESCENVPDNNRCDTNRGEVCHITRGCIETSCKTCGDCESSSGILSVLNIFGLGSCSEEECKTECGGECYYADDSCSDLDDVCQSIGEEGCGDYSSEECPGDPCEKSPSGCRWQDGICVNNPICGNGDCEGDENCINCPGDCLKQGEICCNNNPLKPECNKNEDCNDGDLCTTETCKNPGTCSAICEIKELLNSGNIGDGCCPFGSVGDSTKDNFDFDCPLDCGKNGCEPDKNENCDSCRTDCKCEGSDKCENGNCVQCEPNCAGKQCGPDGCGGTCGLGCLEPTPFCNYNGICIDCEPNCRGKICGDDGCGNPDGCGACGFGCQDIEFPSSDPNPYRKYFLECCKNSDNCFSRYLDRGFSCVEKNNQEYIYKNSYVAVPNYGFCEDGQCIFESSCEEDSDCQGFSICSEFECWCGKSQIRPYEWINTHCFWGSYRPRGSDIYLLYSIASNVVSEPITKCQERCATNYNSYCTCDVLPECEICSDSLVYNPGASPLFLWENYGRIYKVNIGKYNEPEPKEHYMRQNYVFYNFYDYVTYTNNKPYEVTLYPYNYGEGSPQIINYGSWQTYSRSGFYPIPVSPGETAIVGFNVRPWLLDCANDVWIYSSEICESIVEGVGIKADVMWREQGELKDETIDLVQVSIEDSGLNQQRDLQHVKFSGYWMHCDDGNDFTTGDRCIQGKCEGIPMCFKPCEVHSGEEIFNLITHTNNIVRSKIETNGVIKKDEEYIFSSYYWNEDWNEDAELTIIIEGDLNEEVILIDEEGNLIDSPKLIVKPREDKQIWFKVKAGKTGNLNIKADVIRKSSESLNIDIADVTIAEYVHQGDARCLGKTGGDCYSENPCSNGQCVNGGCTDIGVKKCTINTNAGEEIFKVIVSGKDSPYFIKKGEGFTDFINFENTNMISVKADPFVEGDILKYIRELSISGTYTSIIDPGKSENISFTILPEDINEKISGEIKLDIKDTKGCYKCEECGEGLLEFCNTEEECTSLGLCIPEKNLFGLLEKCSPDPEICRDSINEEKTLATISIEKYVHEGDPTCLAKTGRPIIESVQQQCKLLDFYIDGCIPCLELDKVIQELKIQYPEKYIIEKINGNNNLELVAKYNIQSYPTLVFVDEEGRKIESINDIKQITLETLKNMLDRNLAKCKLDFKDSCDDKNGCTDDQCKDGKCTGIPKKCPECQKCGEYDYAVDLTQLPIEGAEEDFTEIESFKTRSYRVNKGDEMSWSMKYTNYNKNNVKIVAFYYDNSDPPIPTYLSEEEVIIYPSETKKINLSILINQQTKDVQKISILIHPFEYVNDEERVIEAEKEIKDIFNINIHENTEEERFGCAKDDKKDKKTCSLAPEDRVSCSEYGLCLNGFCEANKCTKETEREVCGFCGECIFENPEDIIGECQVAKIMEGETCKSSACAIKGLCNACSTSNTEDLTNCPSDYSFKCLGGSCAPSDEKESPTGPDMCSYENMEYCSDPVLIYPSQPSYILEELQELGSRYLSEKDLLTYEGNSKAEAKLNEFLSDSITVSFWYDGMQNENYQTFLSDAAWDLCKYGEGNIEEGYGGNNGKGYLWIYRQKSKDYIVWQYCDGSIGGTKTDLTTNPNFLTECENKWCHVTLIMDYANKQLKSYINGELKFTDTTTNNIVFPSADTSKYIGSFSSTSQFLTGGLDEFRIYNKKLSESEVLSNYLEALGADVGLIDKSKLVLYYPLEGNANDASGNKNHGTVNGATSTQGQLYKALSFDGVNDYIKTNSFKFEYRDLSDEVRNLAGLELGKVRLYKAYSDFKNIPVGELEICLDYIYIISNDPPVFERHLLFKTGINEYGREVVTHWSTDLGNTWISIKDDKIPKGEINKEVIMNLKANPTGYSKPGYIKDHLSYILDRGGPESSYKTCIDKNKENSLTYYYQFYPTIDTPYKRTVDSFNSAIAQYKKVQENSYNLKSSKPIKDQNALLQSTFSLASIYSEIGEFEKAINELNFLLSLNPPVEIRTMTYIFRGEIFKEESIFIVPDPSDMAPLYRYSLEDFARAINLDSSGKYAQYAKNSYANAIKGSLEVINRYQKIQVKQAWEILSNRLRPDLPWYRPGAAVFTVQCIAGKGVDDLTPEFTRDSNQISSRQLGLITLQGLYYQNSNEDPFYLNTFLTSSEIDRLRAIANLIGVWMPSDEEIKEHYHISEVTMSDMDKYICGKGDDVLKDHWNLVRDYLMYVRTAVREVPDISLLATLDQSQAKELMRMYGSSEEQIEKVKPYFKFRIAEEYAYKPESLTMTNEILASMTTPLMIGSLLLSPTLRVVGLAKQINTIRFAVLTRRVLQAETYANLFQSLAREAVIAYNERGLVCGAIPRFSYTMGATALKGFYSGGKAVTVKGISFIAGAAFEELVTEKLIESVLLAAKVPPDIALLVSEYIGIPGGPETGINMQSDFSFIVPDFNREHATLYPELVFKTKGDLDSFEAKALSRGGIVREIRDPKTGELIGDGIELEVQGNRHIFYPYVEGKDVSMFRWGKISHKQIKESVDLSVERQQLKAYMGIETFIDSDGEKIEMPIIYETSDGKPFIEVIVRDNDARETLLKKIPETHAPLYVIDSSGKKVLNKKTSKVKVDIHENWMDFIYNSGGISKKVSYYVNIEGEELPASFVSLDPQKHLNDWFEFFHDPSRFVYLDCNDILEGHRPPKRAPVGKGIRIAPDCNERIFDVFPEQRTLHTFEGIDPAELKPVPLDVKEKMLSGYYTPYFTDPSLTSNTDVDVVEWKGDIWFVFRYKLNPDTSGELISPMERGQRQIAYSYLIGKKGFREEDISMAAFGFEAPEIIGRRLETITPSGEVNQELLVFVKRYGDQKLKVPVQNSVTSQLHSLISTKDRAYRIRAGATALRFLGYPLETRNIVLTDTRLRTIQARDIKYYDAWIQGLERPWIGEKNPMISPYSYPETFEAYLRAIKAGIDPTTITEYKTSQKFKEEMDEIISFGKYVENTMDVGFDPAGLLNDEKFLDTLKQTAETIYNNPDYYTDKFVRGLKRGKYSQNQIIRLRNLFRKNIDNLLSNIDAAWQILDARGLISTSPNVLKTRVELIIEKANKLNSPIKTYSVEAPREGRVSEERNILGDIVEYDYNNAHGKGLSNEQKEALAIIASSTGQKIKNGYNRMLSEDFSHEVDVEAATFANSEGTASAFESDSSKEYSRKLSQKLGREIKAIEIGWFGKFPGKEMSPRKYKELLLKTITYAKIKGYNAVIFQTRFNHGGVHRSVINRIVHEQKCDPNKVRAVNINDEYHLLEENMITYDETGIGYITNPDGTRRKADALELVVYGNLEPTYLAPGLPSKRFIKIIRGNVKDPETGGMFEVEAPIEIDVTFLENIDEAEKILSRHLGVRRIGPGFIPIEAKSLNLDGCFPAGTKILMSNGDYENIEDIKTGNLVLSYDEKNKKQTIGVITKLESFISDDMCKIVFSDGSEIKLTENHPIFTLQGIKSIDPEATKKEGLAVSKLEKEDMVIAFDSNYKTVKNISCWNEISRTYNFKVKSYENYFAEGVLVHNKPQLSIEGLYGMLIRPMDYPNNFEVVYNSEGVLLYSHAKVITVKFPEGRKFRWRPQDMEEWWEDHGPSKNDGFEDANLLMAEYFKEVVEADNPTKVEVIGINNEGLAKRLHWDVAEQPYDPLTQEPGPIYNIHFYYSDITQN